MLCHHSPASKVMIVATPSVPHHYSSVTHSMSSIKKMIKQVWLWPYKAPGIVDSGSYDISIVCGPKDISHENLF